MLLSGRAPSRPGEAVVLFILVTLNASYESIHLNQHLPLAASLQSGSREAEKQTAAGHGRGVRAVARGDVRKGRKERKGVGQRAAGVGRRCSLLLRAATETPLTTSLCEGTLLGRCDSARRGAER